MPSRSGATSITRRAYPGRPDQRPTGSGARHGRPTLAAVSPTDPVEPDPGEPDPGEPRAPYDPMPHGPDEVGVGPWVGPLPSGAEYDAKLLVEGDRRNVVDRYRYWTM